MNWLAKATVPSGYRRSLNVMGWPATKELEQSWHGWAPYGEGFFNGMLITSPAARSLLLDRAGRWHFKHGADNTATKAD